MITVMIIMIMIIIILKQYIYNTSLINLHEPSTYVFAIPRNLPNEPPFGSETPRGCRRRRVNHRASDAPWPCAGFPQQDPQLDDVFGGTPNDLGKLQENWLTVGFIYRWY
jgi:hypothetical protein